MGFVYITSIVPLYGEARCEYSVRVKMVLGKNMSSNTEEINGYISKWCFVIFSKKWYF